MAAQSWPGGGVCKRFRPHILMVLVQLGYTFLYVITEASFNHGMNPHVYVTYRHIVATLVTWPFAYFLERVSLTLNMYFASLRYTSPTFVASMVNTIASLTFIIAILLRMESFDVKNLHGMAKVAGTVVSLAGVTTMTLYKGPAIKNLWGAIIQLQGNAIHESWVKGSILTVASCVTWSIWYIMQAVTLKKYPAQLSLTTWMNFLGSIQSAVFTVIIEHKPQAWAIGFNIDLWSTLYAGIVCSGLIIFIQLWCTEAKGPVFVTMFNPLSTVLVAILAYFVLGEKLYTGSVIGAIVGIIGLYLVLWGKEDGRELNIKSEELHYFGYAQNEHPDAHKCKCVEKGNTKESLEVQDCSSSV
ncbi:hypothetical protein Taro_008228 [Colocasia esculenta]|uniref:WAT1-related protein n=1 Tax=Colocasia esculenta TaxID=4460 RepID=A0A843U2T2_COLES|nr:hypothetical protein [Colocasia esculenta]